MGGVWGVISGKFVVTAAGLLIASRIGQDRLNALIDPDAATSMISRGFAERHHLPHPSDAHQTANGRALTIGIGAEEFDQPALDITDTKLPSGSDLLIGRDILKTHAFAIDMRHKQISLLGKGDVERLSRNFVKAALSVRDDGRLFVRVAIGGMAQQAELHLSAADRFSNGSAQQPPLSSNGRPQIQIGNLILNDASSTRPSRPADAASLGLNAFEGRMIVLDLPHDALWISKNR